MIQLPWQKLLPLKPAEGSPTVFFTLPGIRAAASPARPCRPAAMLSVSGVNVRSCSLSGAHTSTTKKDLRLCSFSRLNPEGSFRLLGLIKLNAQVSDPTELLFEKLRTAVFILTVLLPACHSD